MSSRTQTEESPIECDMQTLSTPGTRVLHGASRLPWPTTKASAAHRGHEEDRRPSTKENEATPHVAAGSGKRLRRSPLSPPRFLHWRSPAASLRRSGGDATCYPLLNTNVCLKGCHALCSADCASQRGRTRHGYSARTAGVLRTYSARTPQVLRKYSMKPAHSASGIEPLSRR